MDCTGLVTGGWCMVIVFAFDDVPVLAVGWLEQSAVVFLEDCKHSPEVDNELVILCICFLCGLAGGLMIGAQSAIVMD